MGINKFEDHILIFPEDDANREIVNGLTLLPNIKLNKIQIMQSEGGWIKLIESFKKNHLDKLKNNEKRRVVLLLDFDSDPDRKESIKKELIDSLPISVKERIFIFGAYSEPEDLRRKTKKSFETIGKELLKDCPDNISELWSNELLQHNLTEVDRFRKSVPFLFG